MVPCSLWHMKSWRNCATNITTSHWIKSWWVCLIPHIQSWYFICGMFPSGVCWWLKKGWSPVDVLGSWCMSIFFLTSSIFPKNTETIWFKNANAVQKASISNSACKEHMMGGLLDQVLQLFPMGREVCFVGVALPVLLLVVNRWCVYVCVLLGNVDFCRVCEWH